MAFFASVARVIAEHAHDKQKDKQGSPYIDHVQRVVALADDGTDDVETVAWLHDVVEDSTWTLTDLLAFGFNSRVMEALELLTRKPPFAYATYIQAIKDSENELAIKVKIADLKDHLAQLATCPTCPPYFQSRYEKALETLQR